VFVASSPKIVLRCYIRNGPAQSWGYVSWVVQTKKFEKILSIGWVVLSDVENFEKICVSKNTRFVVVVSKSDWNLKIYLHWIGQICFVHSENYVWDAIFWKKFENRFRIDLENVSNMWRQILQKKMCDFRCSKNFNSCWKSVVHK